MDGEHIFWLPEDMMFSGDDNNNNPTVLNWKLI